MKKLTSSQRAAELAKIHNELEVLKPQLLRMYIITAELQRKKYEAFIQSGFTADQSMKLIINDKLT